MKTKKTVSGLWLGDTLPFLAELSIRSYLSHGINFQLFTYKHYSNIPEGTIIMDAREVIAEDNLFINSTGSLAPFADWFRNTWMLEHGGIWTELDIICLSSDIPNENEAWFALYEEGLAAIGVIAFPPHHPVMETLCKISGYLMQDSPWARDDIKSSKQCARIQYPNAICHKQTALGYSGMELFTQVLNSYNMLQLAAAKESIYPIDYTSWRNCYDAKVELNSAVLTQTWAVHVWNELFSRDPYNIDDIHPESIVGKQLTQLMPNVYSGAKHINSTALFSSLAKQADCKILVGICSCINAKERRDAVRDTWMQKQVDGVQCAFFIGIGEGLGEECDCVQFATNDIHNYLAQKAMAFFEYALRTLEFEWLFKCDDASYIDIERLTELCESGCDFISSTWLDESGSPSGSTVYMLSRQLVEKIVTLYKELPRTEYDELNIGEFALKLCETPFASPRFSLGNYPSPMPDNHIITAHLLSPNLMRTLHRRKTQELSFSLYGAHPHWSDIVDFYTDGVFQRKEAMCAGSWSIDQDGRLKLAWQHWGTEILSPCEGGYEAGNFMLMDEGNLKKQHISPSWYSTYKHQIYIHSQESQSEIILRGRRFYALRSEEYLGDIIYYNPDSIMLKRPDTAPEFYTLAKDGQYHLWQAPQFTRKQKVGILYICTGRYDIFWESFYKAARKNLFLEHDVHYYVFSDSDKVQESADVTQIPKPFSPWPHDLIHRYHTFVEHEEILSDCDFLYFFNANCLPATPIGNEVFPDEQQGLLATLHYGYCHTHPRAYTHERNPQSQACIPAGRGYAYMAGGFNGGRRKDFMRMSHSIKENVDSDSAKGLMALWHDESHWNCYLLDKSPLIVAPNYLLPNDASPNRHEFRSAFSPFLKTICREKSAMIDIGYLKQFY